MILMYVGQHLKWLIIKLKNPIKTCVSDCVNCFTVMLSGGSKHCKLSQIFLVMDSLLNSVMTIATVETLFSPVNSFVFTLQAFWRVTVMVKDSHAYQGATTICLPHTF